MKRRKFYKDPVGGATTPPLNYTPDKSDIDLDDDEVKESRKTVAGGDKPAETPKAPDPTALKNQVIKPRRTAGGAAGTAGGKGIDLASAKQEAAGIKAARKAIDDKIKKLDATKDAAEIKRLKELRDQTNPQKMEDGLKTAGIDSPRDLRSANLQNRKAEGEANKLDSDIGLQNAQKDEIPNKSKREDRQLDQKDEEIKLAREKQSSENIINGLNTGFKGVEAGTQIANMIVQHKDKRTEINHNVHMKAEELRSKKEELAVQKEMKKDEQRNAAWEQQKANIEKEREVQKNRENSAGNALAKAGSTGGIGQNGDMLEKKKERTNAQGQEEDRRTAQRKQSADKARSEREASIAEMARIRNPGAGIQNV